MSEVEISIDDYSAQMEKDRITIHKSLNTLKLKQGTLNSIGFADLNNKIKNAELTIMTWSWEQTDKFRPSSSKNKDEDVEINSLLIISDCLRRIQVVYKLEQSDPPKELQAIISMTNEISKDFLLSKDIKRNESLLSISKNSQTVGMVMLLSVGIQVGASYKMHQYNRNQNSMVLQYNKTNNDKLLEYAKTRDGKTDHTYYVEIEDGKSKIQLLQNKVECLQKGKSKKAKAKC
jgi:hypothetical protein